MQIVGIFVITVLSHCTLCKDGSHTFVSFQTVICFCDRVRGHLQTVYVIVTFWGMGEGGGVVVLDAL